MVKLMVSFGHPVSAAEFENYYENKHMPIALKIPGVKTMEQTKLVGTPDGGKSSKYRTTSIYFDSVDELKKQMGSPEGQATVKDIPNFATGGVDVNIGEVLN